MQTPNELTLLLVFLAVVVSGCSPSSDQPASTNDVSENGILTVFVVNYPLQYLAERIGGEHVRVVFPATADEDPAFWVPEAETITAYQQSDLILLNGASYASWTETASLPQTKVVNTTAAVADQYITVEDAVTHSHGPAGEHAHVGTAFTTWLDPRMALAQAEAIQEALARLRPQREDDFRANLTALRGDLIELDQELTAAVQGKSERPVLFSHPVYQYLQRRYNLNAKSVHWEPGQVPPQEMWDALAGLLEQYPAKWMVWEGTPAEENVRRLNDLGVQSTVFDPCGKRPEEGAFLEVMRRNAESLRRVYAD